MSPHSVLAEGIWNNLYVHNLRKRRRYLVQKQTIPDIAKKSGNLSSYPTQGYSYC